MAPKPPSSTLQAPAATSSSLSAPTLPHPAPSSANPTSKHSEQPPAASSPPNPNPKSKKRKRKDNVHILHQTTFRKPSWTYFHLNLVTPAAIDTTSTSMSKPAASPATASLDLLTVSSLLTPPLTAFLGLTGSSIAIDILKTQGCDVWIRVARQDARALRASLTGWMGSCEAGRIFTRTEELSLQPRTLIPHMLSSGQAKDVVKG
ncbi:hypothetical protein BDV95DRAFT_601032 [Massariosphaeria phaeospora]|uniref:Ribonucleases P/MRP subunit Pop8-like domain-containing protein n=1 Tax=Massariosphaeria phaeospora TaxID=100035 RepID=A0A7C8IFJ2_9PLEO|nr:hypothetical protein BDV95DRAFT_601032 [Massariosphaeria phaeospora]